MSDVTLPNTINPPTVSTSEVQGNDEALRDHINGDGWVSVEKIADNTLTEAKNIAGATGLAKGCFSAYRSAADTVANGSGEVIVFDAEEWDVSGWYAVGTGRFTPQAAGYYRLGGRVTLEGETGLASGELFLRKNGSTAKRLDFGYVVAPNPITLSGSALVSANGSTDYFELFVIHSDTDSVAVANDASESFFQGELIGRS